MKSWLVPCILIAWLFPASVDHCLDPPPVNFSILIATSTEERSLVTYNCIKGYHLEGKKELFCNKTSLVWDSPTPVCLLGHCPNPMLVNGQLNSSKLEPVSEEEVVTFKCDVGYILKGSNWSQCQKDHTWSPPLPMCITGQCESPKRPKHGHFKARDFNSGSNITFRCDVGYQLIGAQSLQCMDGEWSDEIPICEEILESMVETEKEPERNICETVQKLMQCQKERRNTLEELKYSLEIKKLQLEKKKAVMGTEIKEGSF
ncbi:C4b-binding protein beta chain [Trichosurus vulpecula]|uniref:C4b-binding protein beta chain n=1 Tax=Trichosurus vulpecula TaxID=9337 RepID=UPI00186AC50B|nr:C4b-binding protein beta chain [Trichosurus vulpecula]XP_036613079.1 C4b-binding protein beta chain [Trichosurus vulpecula]XP_036613080.1 C4b-binding protein beta chain [Trichosurus vulpecula]XP_036613081.1 C4b-binding protein beta chain [Trichosurus vulpecula]